MLSATSYGLIAWENISLWRQQYASSLGEEGHIFRRQNNGSTSGFLDCIQKIYFHLSIICL